MNYRCDVNSTHYLKHEIIQRNLSIKVAGKAIP